MNTFSKHYIYLYIYIYINVYKMHRSHFFELILFINTLQQQEDEILSLENPLSLSVSSRAQVWWGAYRAKGRRRRPLQRTRRSVNSFSSSWCCYCTLTSAIAESRPTERSASAACPTAEPWRTSLITWRTVRPENPARVSAATCLFSFNRILFSHK